MLGLNFVSRNLNAMWRGFRLSHHRNCCAMSGYRPASRRIDPVEVFPCGNYRRHRETQPCPQFGQYNLNAISVSPRKTFNTTSAGEAAIARQIAANQLMCKVLQTSLKTVLRKDRAERPDQAKHDLCEALQNSRQYKALHHPEGNAA